PACAFVQSTVQAALEIAQKEDLTIGDIKNIEVRIFPQSKYYPGCDCTGPFDGIMQAQMSNQFAVASILVHKGIRFENYRNYHDRSVQDLARKVKIIEDGEAKSKYPDEQLAKIEVFLNDGSSRKAVSRNPRFLEDSEVVEKCRAYLSRVLDNGACSQFIEIVQSLETLDDVNELTRLLDRDMWSISKG
ncbi:MmgE/PrpD family protein, partial [bacterium]|nr:MmgE/PrpD family protein [bacterium]